MDIRESADESLLKQWGIEPRGYLFCSAGRIERTKGLHTLLEAYGKLRLDIPLVIAGGGRGTDSEYYDYLKKIKPPGVMFAGFLTGDDYYSLCAHALVFVFPSEYEAMSMALLEGLSYGIPTVYSDIPENTAVAAGLGFSFEVSNAASLAAGLDYALAHPEEAAGIGRKAKAEVEKNHNWAAIADQYDEIYTSLSR